MLSRLCGPKASRAGHDVREATLEGLANEVMTKRFGCGAVRVRRPIAETLGLGHAAFPARSMPDIALVLDDGVHLCELKSSRTDYKRFDSVFNSRDFRDYLRAGGHCGADPWEVEQDLIKLRLFYELSDRVKSCILVIVDAYTGRGRSWASVFSDRDSFVSTMRTALVRGWAHEVLAATTIEQLISDGLKAQFISCRIRPAQGGSMNTAAEAILEAMRALGGEGSISQVTSWIEERMPGK
jgi:hypothetical protein